MRAVVFERYGPPEVLRVSEVDKPSPREGEVLIKIQATSVTKYDCWVRSATAPPGFGLLMRLASGTKPRRTILGTELAGEVEPVGANVLEFKAGDAVYGYSGMNLGSYAEYICLPVTSVATKPVNLRFDEAAGVLQGALTALFFLRKANLQPGQKVLIFGASGGVGGWAVQLAKSYFDTEVTGVCSAGKIDYVRTAGADRVIDYSREDFSRNGQVYDVLFDTVGKTSITRSHKSLEDDGWYLLATFGLSTLLQVVWLSRTTRQNFAWGALEEEQDDLVLLKELLEAGVIKPIVDRCFPLAQAAEAHRYVESGLKRGSVILRMGLNQNGRPGDSASKRRAG
jgi:NADPH:quinone reductase-like Zn-dependent oxidoreductase